MYVFHARRLHKLKLGPPHMYTDGWRAARMEETERERHAAFL